MAPTYANWVNQLASPRTYTAISIDELHALVHSPTHLFARKFAPGCAGLEPLLRMHKEQDEE